MPLTTDILISAPIWEKQGDLEALTRSVVRQCVQVCDVPLARDCELSVNFCDDSAIRALNAQWRGLDKATNVLSFSTPGTLAAKPALGDIVIAFETVAREASEQSKPFLNHASHMIIHGFLHLIGYDHETRLDAEKMEAMERRIASALELPDPYAGTQPVEDELGTYEINCLHIDDE
jgi:probable rRNA maturation factor